MAEIPQEAAEAVKLSRTDAVKLVADQMIADAAADVDRTFAEMNEARDAFRAYCAQMARAAYDPELQALAGACGMKADLLCARVLYEVHENGADSGDVAEVVFADTEKSYDAKLRLVVRVHLSETAGGRLRTEWVQAMARHVAARERDVRVGAMKKDAREILIKGALDSSDEGRAVVAAIKALAASLRGKS